MKEINELKKMLNALYEKLKDMLDRLLIELSKYLVI